MKSLRIAVLTAVVAVWLAGTLAHGQILNPIYEFSYGDGSGPSAPLIEGVDSNFYGTTYYGGATGNGTVFKITPAGVLTTLWDFCSLPSCADGSGPDGALVLGFDGNFYGTTYQNGANGSGGTVFQMTSAGALTTLWSFCSLPSCDDGDLSEAALVQGVDSNFYGTTSAGGTNDAGTVFKITPAGALTTLWDFCSLPGCSDGATPYAPLVRGVDGNFYGTASGGGTNNDGTVFKITPAGALTTLYQFSGPDGAIPDAALVQGVDSNFYGTTYFGGATGNGTVFKITPAGALTTLWSFCSLTGCPDGANPEAALFQATDGNFYGTCENGGADFSGTIFKITPAGVLTTLWSFCSLPGCADGATPYAALVQGTDGNFYGTTPNGGTGFFIDNNDVAHPAKVHPAEAVDLGYGTVYQLIVAQPCGISGTLGICPGQSTTLTANPGMLSYLWSGPQDSGATNQSITVDTTGTYYVTQVDSNSLTNTCSATVTNLSGGTPCIWKCPTNITCQIPPGSCCATVTWSAPCASNSCGPVNCWCSPACGSCFSQGITPVCVTACDSLGQTITRMFDVTVTQSANCGIAVSGNAKDSTTICQGSTVILTALNGMKSYLWSGPEQNGATVQTIVVGTPGTYSCMEAQYYGSTNCCSVTITVNPPPDCSDITGNLLITNGLPTTLVGPNGMASQYWTGPQNNGLASQSNTVIDSGTYTIHVTDTNGCQNACSVFVRNRTPQACSITASGDAGDLFICQGRKTILTAENGMVSYYWSGPEQTGATTQFIVVGTQGTYTVTQIDHLGLTNNCSVYLTVHPMPSVNIFGTRTICQGTHTTLCGPPGMSQYLWLGPQNNGFEGQSNTVSFPGTYTLTVTDSNGCQNAVSAPVTVINCSQL